MTRLSKLSRSIAGKVALITGAASGMGRATAHLFADEGAHVAVTDVNGDGVAEVVAEIKTAGLSAEGWILDLADPVRIKTVVDEVAARFGGLDILVNNAGISQHALIDDDEYEEIWDRHLDILLRAHTRTIRAALPHLRASDGGRIVNIASTEGLGATPETSPYTSAKHGVIGLTRSMAVELGREGITVNCICPGAIRTGMTAGIKEEHKQIFARRRVPLARYAEPEEVAHGTLNFVLPASSYINGAVLPVDAGLTIKNA
ncbi:MAG: SDR family oxidoreductase [Rhodospirillaceae bacterium]|jgi:3-oxoacyl-[acyl-carrier protein] reductase|nr:SDR family oxidoreductase [Rhodospirillaceae bacterium]MBT3492798.1 SDR family oxidoreductase [Rhodospirillaceae bacterium]MBT3779507.1 SDR family oxidoreductase [Rhodospirillaceae bacterium]MBT3977930.1 SDR family oxidoreductase [Rhodospirillaceae bacterium]MBT4166706.1 SDR family oxidoreductase [Rhodospirillaceae bacterium]